LQKALFSFILEEMILKGSDIAWKGTDLRYAAIRAASDEVPLRSTGP
jgi:hypothetical protein